jgi:hypothetical protein
MSKHRNGRLGERSLFFHPWIGISWGEFIKISSGAILCRKVLFWQDQSCQQFYEFQRSGEPFV